MQQDKNIINVTSYQQTGGVTVGQINNLLKNEKSKKKSKWIKVIMIISLYTAPRNLDH